MLVPYNTDVPIYHFPAATIGLIAVNTLVFIVTLQADPQNVAPWILQLCGIASLAVGEQHFSARRLSAHPGQHVLSVGLWPGGRRQARLVAVLVGLSGHWRDLSGMEQVAMLDGTGGALALPARFSD